MHSHIGSLRCVDCQDAREFSSAASLLSHFAQHILDNENSLVVGTADTLGSHSTPSSPSPRKRKSDSILEQVLQRTSLKHTTLHKEKANEAQKGINESAPVTVLIPVRIPPPLRKLKQSGVPQFPSAEPSSECSVTSISPIGNESAETGASRSCSSSSSSSSTSSSSSVSSRRGTKSSRPAKLTNGSQVSLATFDMQQRLENCVLNLVSKRENCGTPHSTRAMPPLIPTKKYFSDENDAWESTGDEINPLTLCTVTIDEGDGDEPECKGSDSPRKNGGRKQPSPKKITRPENGVISELSSKLPLNTTITSVCSAVTTDKEKSHTKKKYPCHICSKVFGWSTDLKRHILIHTGERPFKCKLCPSSFTRNFLLQKHENKVHHRHNSNTISGQLNKVALKLQSIVPSSVVPEEYIMSTEVSEDERCQEGDDRSSADENDNHSRKRKILDVEVSEQCTAKQPWHCSPVSQQRAIQKI